MHEKSSIKLTVSICRSYNSSSSVLLEVTSVIEGTFVVKSINFKENIDLPV